MKKAFDQASNAGGETAKFVSIDGGENIVLRGQAETAQKCMVARDSGQNLANGEGKNVSSPAPSALTFGIDHATGMLIAGVLSERKDAGPHPSRYRVETRFTQSKMERRLVSEFGLISSIIAMFASD
jgi:hypothetical protein